VVFDAFLRFGFFALRPMEIKIKQKYYFDLFNGIFLLLPSPISADLSVRSGLRFRAIINSLARSFRCMSSGWLGFGWLG
jgi:hypothetical protein